MKIASLIIAGLFGTALASQGAVIAFERFDANGNQPNYRIDGGSLLTAAVIDSFGDPTTYSFTLNSDLDGGGVNDTLTFDLVYTIYTGSTFSGGNVSLGSTVAMNDPNANSHYFQNYVGDPNTDVIDPDESIRLSVQNISYTNGEGYPNAAIRFLGFEQFSKFGGSSDGQDLLLGTIGYSTIDVAAGTGAVVDFGGYVAGDLVLTTNIESGTANQRFRDLHFDFETYYIPEPSTLALLGIGGAMLMVARRRKRS